jgi:hypothetical protein
MTLNPVASNLMIAWYLGLSLILTLAIIGMTVLLYQLNTKLESLTAQVEPLLGKADQTLALANEKLASIGSTTESLLAHGEAVAATVEAKTETTARMVQKTVYTPFVGVNALLAGVVAGARALGGRQRRNVLQSARPQQSFSEEINHGK